MRRHYQILCPLFSLFLTRVDLTDLAPLKYSCEIAKIYDGDTLLVRVDSRLIKLRLEKVDAPEKGQPFLNGNGDAGLESRKCLIGALKEIPRPYTIALKQFDIYGRSLGDISGLSEALVRKGCSSLYPHAQFESKEEKRKFLVWLNQAQTKRLGLWSQGGYLKPKSWRRLKRKTNRKKS